MLLNDVQEILLIFYLGSNSVYLPTSLKTRLTISVNFQAHPCAPFHILKTDQTCAFHLIPFTQHPMLIPSVSQ
jgi:hypothetical protein